MSPCCSICEEETGFLTCRHVGALCFDCWGSGIHEVMKRKISAAILGRSWLSPIYSRFPLQFIPDPEVAS